MSEVRAHGPSGAAVHSPRPNTVPYNDWRQVDVPPVDEFEPTLGVSVVVPYYEAPEKLALTLAGLEGQTYPRHLFEVVIVDDGSEPPLGKPSSPLNVTVVRQDNRGFGLARARNNGARAATHDILVFLDGDMIAEANWLAEHARWHHVLADALTLGFYARVSVEGVGEASVRDRPGSLRELFADRESDPPWTQRHMVRTGNFTSKHDDLFRAVSGGNLGVGKPFYLQVGGTDETYSRNQDTEFGYRAYVQGGLLVPLPDAFAWHQGRWLEDRAAKRKQATILRAKHMDRIAHPDFRPESPGRIFAVPQYVVTIRADESPEKAMHLAEQVLGDPVHDLVVRIEFPDETHQDDRTWIENALGSDPRVRIAPSLCALDEFPASPFHVDLPGCADYTFGLVSHLRAALGTAVQASYETSGGLGIPITRAWARHRARRTGLAVQHFGECVSLDTLPQGRYRTMSSGSRRVDERDLSSPKARVTSEMRRIRDIRGAWQFAKWLSHGARWWAARGRKVRGRHHLPPHAPKSTNASAMARVRAEARNVRGIRTGWSFVRWFWRKFRWWVVNRDVRPLRQSTAKSGGASYSLGVEIVALGKCAKRTFAASKRVATGQDQDRHVDVVLADTAALVERIGTPAVVLAENPRLCVPAFDPRLHNPIGWIRNVERRAAALGPRKRLPPGVKVHRTVDTTAHQAIRHLHHIEDVRDYHPDAATRAGVLVRLAASGVPIHTADSDPELDALLGTELADLMAADVSDASLDNREQIGIEMRRIALREHTLSARARQVAEAALPDPPRLPTVSVLLATNRPQCLAWAVANVKKQSYPHIELVVALHGGRFEDVDVEQCLRAFPSAKILRLSDDHPLGAVMNAATDAAHGALVAKMDDDDLYDADHIWDLVLALEYSGADIVGKGAETVYLSGLDKTIRRRRDQAETYSSGIAGASLLLPRHTLQRVGGWRRTPRQVDITLIDDVLRAGGRAYRTHGAGLCVVRHNKGHTWDAEDHRFLANAETVHDGWQPSLAGFKDGSRPAFVDAPSQQGAN
ncbi:MAG: glycosyltransferase [Gammaproteobacteria bacterium]|nr:glycosyltransferase [Gammaproteobacteria bacterium]